ncbi:MAG TPA: hypothetical protein VHZ32_17015, partial [Rhizomicrobium sp.]|nr:hypothetical protein [Rhizomicrobium sp.]
MRRFHSISMLLSAITSLLVVMLISVFAYSALDAWRREERTRTVLVDVTAIRQVLNTEAQIRLELGLANLLLDTPDAADTGTIAYLNRMHYASRRALEIVIAQGARNDLVDSQTTARLLRESDNAVQALYPSAVAAMRQARTARDPKVFAAWKENTTALTRQLSTEALLLEQEATGTDPFIDATLRLSDATWDLRMEAGRERGYVQTAIIDNHVPSPAALEYLAQMKGMVLAHWNTIQGLAQRSTMPATIKRAVAVTERVYFGHQMVVRNGLIARLVAGQKVTMTGGQWRELSDHGLSTILTISSTALSLCGDRAMALAA